MSMKPPEAVLTHDSLNDHLVLIEASLFHATRQLERLARSRAAFDASACAELAQSACLAAESMEEVCKVRRFLLRVSVVNTFTGGVPRSFVDGRELIHLVPLEGADVRESVVVGKKVNP